MNKARTFTFEKRLGNGEFINIIETLNKINLKDITNPCDWLYKEGYIEVTSSDIKSIDVTEEEAKVLYYALLDNNGHLEGRRPVLVIKLKEDDFITSFLPVAGSYFSKTKILKWESCELDPLTFYKFRMIVFECQYQTLTMNVVMNNYGNNKFFVNVTFSPFTSSPENMIAGTMSSRPSKTPYSTIFDSQEHKNPNGYYNSKEYKQAKVKYEKEREQYLRLCQEQLRIEREKILKEIEEKERRKREEIRKRREEERRIYEEERRERHEEEIRRRHEMERHYIDYPADIYLKDIADSIYYTIGYDIRNDCYDYFDMYCSEEY